MTKARGILALLLAAAALWIVAGRTWITAAADPTTPVPGVAQATAEAPGNSPLLVACAAIIAVIALLLGLLERVGRWVVGGVAVLAGLGYSGVALATVLAERPHTAWPVVGLLLGLAVAAVAAWVTRASGRWQASARYERSAESDTEGEPGADPTRTWDALSRGEDV